MISENIELVLNGSEKNLYISNLEKALKKINKKVKPNINLVKFQNLFSIYNLDTKYNAERFKEITINKYTGLPTKISINKLFKERTSNLNNEGLNVVEEVNKALLEDKDISRIREKYSKNKYLEDIKSLDTFDEFCEIKTTDRQISISNYENNFFVNYRISFDNAYKDNARIFSEVLKQKINSNSIDKPKYLNTFYERLKEYGILPDRLEKNIIGPFFTNKSENDDYNIRSFVKDDSSFILEYRKQCLEQNRVKKKRKILRIFNKKETLLEKKFLDDFIIYSANDTIRQELYDSLQKNNNMMII